MCWVVWVCTFYYMLLFTFFIHYTFSVYLYISVSLVAFLLIALCSFLKYFARIHANNNTQEIYLVGLGTNIDDWAWSRKQNKRQDIERERIESHRNALIVFVVGILNRSQCICMREIRYYFLCWHSWVLQMNNTPYNFLFRVIFRMIPNIYVCVYGAICRLECDCTL